jgi:hypothetical protein
MPEGMKPCLWEFQIPQQFIQPSPCVSLAQWSAVASLEHSAYLANSQVCIQHPGRADGDCTVALLGFDGDFFTLPNTASFDAMVDVAFNSPRAARALIFTIELGGEPCPMAFESTLPHPNNSLLNRRYDEAIYFTCGVPKQCGVFK